MQKTANTNVDDNDTHVSDPSSDEVVDIDNMSEEELREFAKREHEAKKEANRHMREQARKRESAPVVEKPKEEEPDVDEDDSDDVEAITRKVVKSELQKQTIESISEGSDDWLKEQEFAKDLFSESDQSDKLYARVKVHAQKLADEEGAKTPEEYQDTLRRAHAAITGKADALIQVESAETYITQDKSQASGYRGSSAPQQSPSYSGFSQADMVIIERVNARRVQRGEKPLTAGEILKK